ncbi:MAG TPA: decaprenyl-phosphate phosphoribosyltransferase [Acidimicrobiia bacterium]|nr:decaprenyl-phosphate phosphoribosyltransferase [Acidimicrobiia bacterium]
MDAAESVPHEAPTPRASTPALVRLARPKQWIKNVLVVAAPGAAGVLGQGTALWRTMIAFVCFCLAASGTYFLNDAFDAEADRQHPVKRLRPVASGEVSQRTAITGGIVLIAAALGLSLAARWELVLVIAGYLAVTVAYSVWLKHEAVLDLACVASGFVLRTIAGGVAVGVTISHWFLIVAGSASLFMVTGKRHAELVELGDGAAGHRRALANYSRSFLSYVRGVASSVTVLSYCLWAFENSSKVGNPAWFELSIVPFVLGILRYALLLEQGRGGAPEDLVLSDRVLLATGAVWAILFAVAVHGA